MIEDLLWIGFYPSLFLKDPTLWFYHFSFNKAKVYATHFDLHLFNKEFLLMSFIYCSGLTESILFLVHLLWLLIILIFYDFLLFYYWFLLFFILIFHFHHIIQFLLYGFQNPIDHSKLTINYYIDTYILKLILFYIWLVEFWYLILGRLLIIILEIIKIILNVWVDLT